MISTEDLQRLAARDPHEVGPIVVAMAKELLERRAVAEAAFNEFRKPENISVRLDGYSSPQEGILNKGFGPAPVRNEGTVIGPDDPLHYSGDGIALSSISHPRAPFWSRVWSWFFPPKLHADALEQTVLDLGNGAGLTYERFNLPPTTNRIEEEIRRRLNEGDGM